MRMTRTLECLDCGHAWEADVFYCVQSGLWDVVEWDDRSCRECNSDELTINRYE